MEPDNNFIEIKKSKKIWAIGSIHSKLNTFVGIKSFVLKNFKPNDTLVFLGNIIGVNKESRKTLDSVIDLRNQLMAKFYLKSNKIIFLRGAQEEMFLKLLQLQTSPNPHDILKWMFEHGVDSTIESYGFSSKELINIATQGTLSISKLTSKINTVISMENGHKEYFAHLKHAAFSESKKILFLNRGVDITRPLSAQNDCFWWGYQNFSNLSNNYGSFSRIVRGYQSSSLNYLKDSKNHIVCSLFEQPLTNSKIITGIFRNNGEIDDLFEFI